MNDKRFAREEISSINRRHLIDILIVAKKKACAELLEEGVVNVGGRYAAAGGVTAHDIVAPVVAMSIARRRPITRPSPIARGRKALLLAASISIGRERHWPSCARKWLIRRASP